MWIIIISFSQCKTLIVQIVVGMMVIISFFITVITTWVRLFRPALVLPVLRWFPRPVFWRSGSLPSSRRPCARVSQWGSRWTGGMTRATSYRGLLEQQILEALSQFIGGVLPRPRPSKKFGYVAAGFPRRFLLLAEPGQAMCIIP